MHKINTFLNYVLYPVHALAWLGLIFFHLFFGFEWINVLYFVVGWILIEGVGVAITLHRYVSHKAFEARRGMKPILLWLGCLSLQGSPLGWAAIHRGSHHRYGDTEKDAHTPTKGWLYAWHMWLHDWDQYFNPKYAIDLIRDPMQMWFAKNYIKIILVTYSIVFVVFGWQLLIFGFMLPAAVSLYMESNINVFCHTPGYGYRNFETKDQSRNVPFLAWITWGQGWHNNHHAKASSYDFGTTVSGNWKEFDMSLIMLPLIATKDSRAKIYKDRNDKLHA
jgi:stearoyl-CoA desaturase (delta-9 desaturase)